MPVQLSPEEQRRTNRRDLLTFGCVWLVIFVVSGIAILLQSNWPTTGAFRPSPALYQQHDGDAPKRQTRIQQPPSPLKERCAPQERLSVEDALTFGSRTRRWSRPVPRGQTPMTFADCLTR